MDHKKKEKKIDKHYFLYIKLSSVCKKCKLYSKDTQSFGLWCAEPEDKYHCCMQWRWQGVQRLNGGVVRGGSMYELMNEKALRNAKIYREKI